MIFGGGATLFESPPLLNIRQMLGGAMFTHFLIVFFSTLPSFPFSSFFCLFYFFFCFFGALGGAPGGTPPLLPPPSYGTGKTTENIN